MGHGLVRHGSLNEARLRHRDVNVVGMRQPLLSKVQLIAAMHPYDSQTLFRTSAARRPPQPWRRRTTSTQPRCRTSPSAS